MADERAHRIRLKLPAGAEFEAEGSPEFVERGARQFLALAQGAVAPGGLEGPLGASPGIGQPHIDWAAITESKGRSIQLRAKLGGDRTEKDACLVLLAASQKILNEPKPTAAMLAKWLRRSGYPIVCMDRALQDGVQKGEILASGSRRARRYELTAPGRLKALILADQLTAVITGRA